MHHLTIDLELFQTLILVDLLNFLKNTYLDGMLSFFKF